MNNKIKRYELGNDISLDKLKKVGFRRGGWIKNIPEPKYSLVKYIYDDIELYLEIAINSNGNFSFDDYENIYVIDDAFGQPYTPFYTTLDNETIIEDSNNLENIIDGDDDLSNAICHYISNDYLNEVIKAYNSTMDLLVSEGILKEKKLEKVKQLKKI